MGLSQWHRQWGSNFPSLHTHMRTTCSRFPRSVKGLGLNPHPRHKILACRWSVVHFNAHTLPMPSWHPWRQPFFLLIAWNAAHLCSLWHTNSLFVSLPTTISSSLGTMRFARSFGTLPYMYTSRIH